MSARKYSKRGTTSAPAAEGQDPPHVKAEQAARPRSTPDQIKYKANPAVPLGHKLWVATIAISVLDSGEQLSLPKIYATFVIIINLCVINLHCHVPLTYHFALVSISINGW
jgi:hypothetical protein